jgi:NodT family efflux transporter outer membrane factor (OMF) lipoprotein
MFNNKKNKMIYKNISIYGVAFLLIAASMGMVSCRVTTPYKPPVIDSAAVFRNAVRPADTLSAIDTTSIAAIPYRDFFTDTTLLALINHAVTGNYDLQNAVRNIEYAQKTLRQAKLGNYPTVTLNATGSIDRYSDNSLNGLSINSVTGKSYVEDYTLNVQASWEADIWGKISNRKEAALASYLQTQEAAKTVQTKIVSDVAQGYYNLLMLDAQLEITRKTILLYDSTIFMTRLQRDAGQTTTLAVQQQEAARQASAVAVPQLEQAISIQENALSILSGQMPGVIKRSGNLAQFTVSDKLPTGIPAAMISLRPDVRSSELAVRSAHAGTNVTKASMYPSFNITAQGGLDSYLFNNWFNLPGSLFGMVTGGLTQPLFQQRQLKTQYEQAQIQEEQALISFKQNVLTAVNEVSNALVSLQKLKEQQVIATQRVDTLRNAVKNAILLFKSGMATYLEIITAQNNALQGELNLADIRRQHLSVMVDLYRSLGGGWK